MLRQFNRLNRNEDVHEDQRRGLDVFSTVGQPLGKGCPTKFDDASLKKACQYVLFNYDALEPYLE